MTQLSNINEKAKQEALKYIQDNNYDIDDGFIDFAHGLTTKYGEAAAELSCRMYDELHQYWKEAKKSTKSLLPAEPAEVPTRSDVEKAVYGTLKTSVNEIPGAVSRLVKQTAEDTKIKNGMRDGAEFAWIPAGDSCAFCLVLASRGWQRISKKTLKNGHAEHIHANCDCTYTVRFDSTTEVEGYDPELYRRMWDDADGKNAKEKMRNLRKEVRTDEFIGKYGLDDTLSPLDVVDRIIPQFTPAKTTEEAQEFAKQFTSGGSYSTVDYAGVDLEYANEFNRAMNDVLSQYEPKYKLRNIKPMNMREKQFKGSTADAAYRWGSCDMYFNKGYFKTRKDFSKHIKQFNELLDTVLPNVDTLIDQYKDYTGLMRKKYDYVTALKNTKRTNVSNAEPYGTIVHELGHYLDDNLFRRVFKERGIDISDSREKYATKISAYATADNNEYIAESFLAYWKGETEILDPELIKVFEELKK